MTKQTAKSERFPRHAEPELPSRRGMADLLEQTSKFRFHTLLDIGMGDGLASRYFAAQGKQVTATGFDIEAYLSSPMPDTVKLVPNADICDMSCFADGSFDAVWCSHVLEHVQNPGLALAEIRRVLKPHGMLFLIVPEYAPVLVGGHVNTGWNLGTLMYNLVLSGFNVREGEFVNHCWNICGFVARGELPAVRLRRDKGDLEILAGHFPEEARVRQHMRVTMLQIRWRWHESIRARAETTFRKVYLHRLMLSWTPPALIDALRRLRPRN
ncbi:class I SAM-dependent methyltransferase [Methylomonas sp. 2BW1-5-20]|uniref:class I SAM-dependent methyltransferase n=1 Tax=Methylomonas sp. 2BW1-5-20 TaxID=3376686 RepID=UPI00404E8DFF